MWSLIYALATFFIALQLARVTAKLRAEARVVLIRKRLVAHKDVMRVMRSEIMSAPERKRDGQFLRLSKPKAADSVKVWPR